MTDCGKCVFLELGFSAVETGDGEFEVIDAECERVAVCPTRELAWLIVRALSESSDIDKAACAIDLPCPEHAPKAP